jgi:phosphatidylglycerol---prolipoprotein diacylglyceryl transferase
VQDGLPGAVVQSVGVFGAVCGFAGAFALSGVIARLSDLSFDWRSIRSAGAVHGGVLLALVAVPAAARHYGLPLRSVLRAYLPSATLGLGLGRLGCFLAGCCYGTKASVPWAIVHFSHRANRMTGIPRGFQLHPVQLYDAALQFALFGMLLWFRRRHSALGLVALWCLFEGIARLFVEEFRGDAGRGTIAEVDWLTPGRLTSLVLLSVGSLLALRRGTVSG